MDLSVLSDYLVLVVTGICLCVGYIIKNMVPSAFVNRFIPLTMGVLGVVLNCWLNAWRISPDIVLGGMISGLASTGLYEAFKNLISK